ncbi:MAG: hypothetical protein GEV03_17940 [Streptosporangiales bacterium]|nr:hypothetical protein [Streptosporangiales bacterium]
MGTPTTTIRVSRHTRDRVATLAEQTGQPMTSVLEAALKEYERKIFWDRFTAEVAAVRADPEAWAEVEAERRIEEGALRDGLDDEDDR